MWETSDRFHTLEVALQLAQLSDVIEFLERKIRRHGADREDIASGGKKEIKNGTSYRKQKLH